MSKGRPNAAQRAMQRREEDAMLCAMAKLSGWATAEELGARIGASPMQAGNILRRLRTQKLAASKPFASSPRFVWNLAADVEEADAA